MTISGSQHFCACQIGWGGSGSWKATKSMRCILVFSDGKSLSFLTGTYRTQLLVIHHRFLPWEKRNERCSSPFPPGVQLWHVTKSSTLNRPCVALQSSRWQYRSMGDTHKGLLCRSKVSEAALTRTQTMAACIWSAFSGPVTITLAVAALWLWSRYWESIKITAQDLISQKELSLWISQAPDIVWFPVLHFSLSFLFPLFLDLQLYLEEVLLNKFPFPHEGTYLSLLIGYRTTDHQVMLPFISQVAKETMNSEVTVPVSLSELQYLFGRRPSNFSSALVSHPPDHKILQRLILLPNRGFTYLPSASLWPGTEQNLCILSVLGH